VGGIEGRTVSSLVWVFVSRAAGCGDVCIGAICECELVCVGGVPVMPTWLRGLKVMMGGRGHVSVCFGCHMSVTCILGECLWHVLDISCVFVFCFVYRSFVSFEVSKVVVEGRGRRSGSFAIVPNWHFSMICIWSLYVLFYSVVLGMFAL
jgi:hypothetical protein